MKQAAKQNIIKIKEKRKKQDNFTAVRILIFDNSLLTENRFSRS
jgi:hypothetical protein